MATALDASDVAGRCAPDGPGRGGQRPTYGMVLEQTLGHVTHADNLRRIVAGSQRADVHTRDVAFAAGGPLDRLPVVAGNWTLRAGLRADRAIAGLVRDHRPDALFVHTQVPGVLAQRWFDRVPTVVSVDATPLQYDALGAHYGHEVGHHLLERAKHRANRSSLARAAHVVAWSAWARDGLVRDYGVPPEKATVVPPGVRVAQWQRPGPRPRRDGVRLLFVGGDLRRKGGDLLLAAFARVRGELGAAGEQLELHMVTRDAVVPQPGVVVHAGMTPNSPELVALYHDADVFCLPTLGDCLPMVLSEAGAAGLPLLSTDVAAIPEVVHDGTTGLVVPAGELDALVVALRELVERPDLRARLGAAAAAHVARSYDADTNAHRLLDVLDRVAGDRPTRRDVLLTVSGEVPADIEEQVASGRRPRPDYLVMAERFGAELLDVAAARRTLGRAAPVVERLGGTGALVGLAAFRRRGDVRVVFSDGEHVGMPYAALCRLAGRRGAQHVMIGHLLSPIGKVLPWRLLGLGRTVDRVLVYASAQRRLAVQRLRLDPAKVDLVPFMVDTAFFAPPADARTARPLVSSAGLEFRDYPTMVEAVRGLDVDVVIAAASPWSRRLDSTDGVELPDNVEVTRLDLHDLRDLYARTSVVVLPLVDVEFQAGVTTLLEAMAMGLPVVCTRTAGQTDVVVDGETGISVPPGDPDALRAALERVLAAPEWAAAMGRRARAAAVERYDVERYADLLGGLVDVHVASAGRARTRGRVPA